MSFLIITISNLIWFFYSLTEGARECFFNHYKNSFRNRDNFNLKRILLTQRLLVMLSIGGIMLNTIGLFAIPFIIGQILMFNFIHKFGFNCVLKRLEKKKPENESSKEPTKVILGLTLQIFIYLFFM